MYSTESNRAPAKHPKSHQSHPVSGAAGTYMAGKVDVTSVPREVCRPLHPASAGAPGIASDIVSAKTATTATNPPYRIREGVSLMSPCLQVPPYLGGLMAREPPQEREGSEGASSHPHPGDGCPGGCHVAGAPFAVGQKRSAARAITTRSGTHGSNQPTAVAIATPTIPKRSMPRSLSVTRYARAAKVNATIPPRRYPASSVLIPRSAVAFSKSENTESAVRKRRAAGMMTHRRVDAFDIEYIHDAGSRMSPATTRIVTIPSSAPVAPDWFASVMASSIVGRSDASRITAMTIITSPPANAPMSMAPERSRRRCNASTRAM